MLHFLFSQSLIKNYLSINLLYTLVRTVFFRWHDNNCCIPILIDGTIHGIFISKGVCLFAINTMRIWIQVGSTNKKFYCYIKRKFFTTVRNQNDKNTFLEGGCQCLIYIYHWLFNNAVPSKWPLYCYMFPDVYVHVKTCNNTEVICSGQHFVVTLIHILSIIKIT